MRTEASHCPACGSHNPSMLGYCLACRADLRGDGQPATVPCPGCASPGAASARFCTACGAKRDGAQPGQGAALTDAPPASGSRQLEALEQEIQEKEGFDVRVDRSGETFSLVLTEKLTRDQRVGRVIDFAVVGLPAYGCSHLAVMGAFEAGLSGWPRAAFWAALALGWAGYLWGLAWSLSGRRTIAVGPAGVFVTWGKVPWFGASAPLGRIAELHLSSVKVGSARAAGTRTVFNLELVSTRGGTWTLLSKHKPEPMALARLVERCLRRHAWKGKLTRSC